MSTPDARATCHVASGMWSLLPFGSSLDLGSGLEAGILDLCDGFQRVRDARSLEDQHLKFCVHRNASIVLPLPFGLVSA